MRRVETPRGVGSLNFPAAGLRHVGQHDVAEPVHAERVDGPFHVLRGKQVMFGSFVLAVVLFVLWSVDRWGKR